MIVNMASRAFRLLSPLVRFGPPALAQTTALRFTRDVAVRHKPENGEHQGGQNIMTTTQLLTDLEGATSRRQDAEPIEDPVLADAEEEEIAELWAGDPGNQGA